MNSLFVRLLNESISHVDEVSPEDFVCDWIVLNEESEPIAEGTAALNELMREVQEGAQSESFTKTVLFISDALTLFIQTEVPGKSSSQMIKALPFTVESYVSTDIEEMHIARGPVRRGSLVDCVVTEREHLSRIVENFAECGIELTFCSTIGMQVQQEGDGVGVFADTSNIWVRTKDQLAQMDDEAFSEAVDFVVQPSDDTEPQIHIKNFTSTHRSINSIGKSPFVEVEEIQDGLFPYVARNFDFESTINILQGEFSTRDRSALDTKRWMTTGTVALTCLLVYMGAVAGQGIWADIRADALTSEAKDLYESIYGSSPGIRNPATRMRQRIDSTQGEAGSFEFLVNEFSKSVDRTVSSSKIININYRDSQRTLTTDLELTSFEALDRFEKSLNQGPISVKIETAELGGLGVRAKLTLTLEQ
ncbi:MAG: type II secretion system protein GspL [Gammaproteobacteria bacterium]|nr:type II secretion system protein GspL [Gammaproteobacteria bacterium]